MIWQETLTIQTPGRGSLEISRQVQAMVAESGMRTAIAQLFVHHTSASLLLCENADPQVLEDLENFMAPWSLMGIRCFVIPPKARTICPRMCAVCWRGAI